MHNSNPPPDARFGNERGASLVLAIFVLVLLTGIGVALLYLSQSEVKMGQASLRPKQAFYVAEAGLEAGRLNLFETYKNLPFGDALEEAAGLNDVLEFDPDAIRPVYDSAGRVTGFTGYGDDVPVAVTTGFGNGWYIAFLTNDPNEPDPFELNETDSNERVMLTGVGAGPDRSFEVVQAIIERNPIFPSSPRPRSRCWAPRPSSTAGRAMPRRSSATTATARAFPASTCRPSGLPTPAP